MCRVTSLLLAHGGGGGTYIDDDRMSFESRFGARNTQFIGLFLLSIDINCKQFCFHRSLTAFGNYNGRDSVMSTGMSSTYSNRNVLDQNLIQTAGASIT